jgi:uncharacterized repeat protein (TIGR01451 family)
MFYTRNIFKQMMGLSLLASLGLVALLSLAQTDAALAADAPPLGSTSAYGVVSSTFTNSNTAPQTIINGSVCYTGVTTLPLTITGTTDTPCTTQITDQGTALSNLDIQLPSCIPLGTAVDLSLISVGANPPGVFPPGCYSSSGAMSIGTVITLSGAGVYIFRPGAGVSAAAFNTAANSIVVLENGACASDVFWAPTSATTLGANSTFAGTIIDAAGITIGSTVNLVGRALAAGGTVTTAADTITVPAACVPSGAVFLGKGFSPATINEGCGVGGVSTLTITLSNPNATAATITSLTDTLPAGTEVAGTPNASNTCGATTFNPSAGDAILTMTGGSIPGGAPGICTVQVDVCAVTFGANKSYVNTLFPGDLKTSKGNNADSALATLIVLSPNSGPQAPTINKSFDPVLITVGGTSSTLTFTLSNPSTTDAYTNVAFTDTLPPELVIAGTPAITNTCNGSVSATPFGNTVTLTGGSILAATSCTVTVNVRALRAGTFKNTLLAGALTVTTGGGPLSNALPAIATLTGLHIPFRAIPTLNEWGVIILMVLAGLGSVYYLRKYRRV